MNKVITITNRRVKFDYDLGQKIVAGISLNGREVKAIRQQRVSLTGAYVNIEKNNLYLKNLELFTTQKEGSLPGKNPKQLLVTKSQMKTLKRDLESKYNTIAITRLILAKYIKIEIAPARGKKLHDKRQTIKRRDTDRYIKHKLKKR